MKNRCILTRSHIKTYGFDFFFMLRNHPSFSLPNNLPLYLIFFVGAWLRLFHLGGRRLFIDESYAWAVSQESWINILLNGQREPHPGLYYAFLKISLFFLPATEFGVRVLSVVFSILALILILWIATRWWGPKAAFYSALFMAFSSYDIYHAQFARYYTEMGFFWLLSYVILVEALENKPRLLLGWAIVGVLMTWTNLYGLVVVYLYGILLWVFWFAYRIMKKPYPFTTLWLMGCSIIAVIGSIPVIYIGQIWRGNINPGAWIPNWSDLPRLFSAISVGLGAGRFSQLIDSVHLVLPLLSRLPGSIIFIFAIPLSGGLAIWQVSRNLKYPVQGDWKAVFALPTLFLPIFLFLYMNLFHLTQWALKPFLGLGYLIYLWAGLGAANASKLFRKVLLIAILAASLITLVPYYTTWRHSMVVDSLFVRPSLNRKSAILTNSSYNAADIFFYLGTGTKVILVTGFKENSSYLWFVSPFGIMANDIHPIDCKLPELQYIQSLYIYERKPELLMYYHKWPDCLLNKKVYIYQDGNWIRYFP
jgi:uncharacterized membrane protein